LEDLKRFLFCDSAEQQGVIRYTAILLIRLGSLQCRWCGKSGKTSKMKQLQQENGAVVAPRRSWSSWMRERREGWCCFPLPPPRQKRMEQRPRFQVGDDFIGHYILLVGYDPDEDVFYYRDPGFDEELCSMEADLLERARSHSGTDHDTIIIRM
jgi:hypothetical protein